MMLAAAGLLPGVPAPAQSVALPAPLRYGVLLAIGARPRRVAGDAGAGAARRSTPDRGLGGALAFVPAVERVLRDELNVSPVFTRGRRPASPHGAPVSP